MKNDRINCVCMLKCEHSSCNHLYNQLTRKELLNHLIHFLFCPTCRADTWMTSRVYIDKYAPYFFSLSGLVAFSVVQIVTVMTLKGRNRFWLLLCEREGSVIYFPLQWEKLCSYKLVVERLMSAAAVSLSFLIDSFIVLTEGSCHEGLHQGPWIADWTWNFSVNSTG